MSNGDLKEIPMWATPVKEEDTPDWATPVPEKKKDLATSSTALSNAAKIFPGLSKPPVSTGTSFQSNSQLPVSKNPKTFNVGIEKPDAIQKVMQDVGVIKPKAAKQITTGYGVDLDLTHPPEGVDVNSFNIGVKQLQNKIANGTVDNTDVALLAKMTNKPPEAIGAFLKGDNATGGAIVTVDNLAKNKEALTNIVNKYNADFGDAKNPDEILNSAENTAKFLDDYQRKLATSDPIKAKMLEMEQQGHDVDMGILNTIIQNDEKLKSDIEKYRGLFVDADANVNDLSLHVINKTAEEDYANAVPRDVTAKKIAQRLDPKRYQLAQSALSKQSGFDALTDKSNVFDVVGAVIDELTPNTGLSKDDMLNSVIGNADIQLNNAYQKLANDKFAIGHLNNDANLINEAKLIQGRVDDNIIKKYPALVMQDMAMQISDDIAKESGQLVGTDTDNYSEKIFGATPSDIARIVQKKGWLTDPDKKGLAMQLITHPEMIKDASYFGGVKDSFVQPFKDLGLSVMDVTGIRNFKDIYSDKVKDELFPKEFADDQTKADFSLLGHDFKTRHIVNGISNLAGLTTASILTEGVAGEAGLSAQAAKRAAAYTSFAIPSIDANLKDSYNFIDNDAERAAYVTLGALINGEGGALLDLGKVSRVPGLADDFKLLSKNIVEKNLTEKAANELLEQGKNKYVDFVVKYGKAGVGVTKETLKGAATMAYFTFANEYNKMAFGDPNTNVDDLLPHAGNAFIDGIFTMLPFGFLGNAANRNPNSSYKEMINKFATMPDAAQDAIRIGAKNEADYNYKMSVINTAKVAKNALDATEKETGKTLLPSQRSVYVANKTIEAALRDKAEKVTDENKKEEYLRKADELAKQSSETLDGLQFSATLEPLYDLYDAEKRYNKAYDDFHTGVVKNDNELLKAKDNYEKLQYKYLENNGKDKTEVKHPEEKTFTDFDKTLFHEGKLTPLGEEVKARIAKGEDITILTSRADTPENKDFISRTLGIPTENIKAGLDAEGKANELTAYGGKKVFYDDNPENVKAAQQTDARVINTGLSEEQQTVMDNVDGLPKTYKELLKSEPTAENADEILKHVSDQWHDEGSRSLVEKDFPKPIIDAAKKIYPQESQQSLSITTKGKDVVVDEGVVDNLKDVEKQNALQRIKNNIRSAVSAGINKIGKAVNLGFIESHDAAEKMSIEEQHKVTQKVADKARQELGDIATFIDKLREKGKTPQEITDFLLKNMDVGGEKSAISANTWQHILDFINDHPDEKATDVLNPDTELAPTQSTEASTPPKKETSGVSGSALKDENGLNEDANKILGLHDNGVNFDLFDNNKLRQIAKDNGIDLPDGAKNADIIEALKKKQNASKEQTQKAFEDLTETDIDKLSPSEKAKLYKENGITNEDGSEITEKDIKDNPLQYSYDFMASSNSGKWNSANSELESAVQGNKKQYSLYKLMAGEFDTFKEFVDFINSKNYGDKIEYTERMRRADETMTPEERKSAIDSYNKSAESNAGDKAQKGKDVLKEHGFEDEKEYSPQEIIDRFPLKGVQKIIYDIIKNVADKLGIKVKFSSSRITEGFEGSNNPLNGEILISPHTLNNGRIGEVLVHEVVHALTTKIISRVNSGVETGLTSKQVSAVKGLKKLYDAVRNDNKLENKYPVKDIFEFIAHLTNDNFVKELESKDRNFLQKVVDFIADILGIGNANELAKKHLKDIISDGTFLEKEGITVKSSDYAANKQGSKLSPKQQLLEKIRDNSKQLSEKYHSEKENDIKKIADKLFNPKADGSNPELVKAVEQSLSTKPDIKNEEEVKAQEPTSQVNEGGNTGNESKSTESSINTKEPVAKEVLRSESGDAKQVKESILAAADKFKSQREKEKAMEDEAAKHGELGKQALDEIRKGGGEPPKMEDNSEGNSSDNFTGVRKEKLKEIEGTKELFEKRGKRKWGEIYDSALKNIQKMYPNKSLYDGMKTRVRELVRKVQDKQLYNPTSEDIAVFNVLRAETHKRIDSVEGLDSDNSIVRQTAIEELSNLNNDLLDIATVTNPNGEAGRAFGMLQSEVNADNGLKIRRMELMRANGGEPLSEADAKWTEEKWKEEKDLMKQEEEIRTKSMQEDFDNRIAELQKDYEEKLKQAGAKGKSTKEQTLNQKGDKNLADKIRKLKLTGTKVDFTFGTWNLAVEGVAKLVEAGKTIKEAIEKLLEDKVFGFKTDKDREDFETLFAEKLIKPTPEETLNKIKEFTKESDLSDVTTEMVSKNLIRDYIDSHIGEVEQKDLLDTAFKDLKKVLPDLSKEKLIEAYLKENEFKQPTKKDIEGGLAEAKKQLKNIFKLTEDIEDLNGLQEIRQRSFPNERAKSEFEQKLYDEKNAKLKEITDRNNKIKEENAKLESERNRQLKKVSELRAKKEQLENGIREKRDKITKVDTPEIEALKKTVKEADANLREAEAFFNKIKKDLQGRTDKINELNANIERAKNDRDLIKTYRNKTDKEVDEEITKKERQLKKAIRDNSSDERVQAKTLQDAKDNAIKKTKEFQRRLNEGDFEEPNPVTLKKQDAELIRLKKQQSIVEEAFRKKQKELQEKNKHWAERAGDTLRSAYVALLIGAPKTLAKVASMSIMRPVSEGTSKLTLGKVFDAIFPKISEVAKRGGESSSLQSVQEGFRAYFRQMGDRKMEAIYDKASNEYDAAAKAYRDYKNSGNVDAKKLKELQNNMNNKLIKSQGSFIYKFIGGSSLKDALQSFVNRSNEIEKQFGKVEGEHFKDGNWLDKANYVMGFIGRSHSAAKTFSGRFSFAAGFMARLEGAVEAGEDISSGDKILEIAHESYLDWERGKYQQYNAVTEWWNKKFNTKDETPAGKFMDALLKSEVAITRVPVNILHEQVMEYTLGAFRALSMASKVNKEARAQLKESGISEETLSKKEFKDALKEQIGQMDATQAATIARCFRKGGLGVGLYALALITGAMHFGIFPHLGQKKKKDEDKLKKNELNPDQVEIGGHKFGELMSSLISHIPAFYPSGMGLGMAQAYNDEIKKGKSTKDAVATSLYTHLKIVEGGIPQFKLVAPLQEDAVRLIKKRLVSLGIMSDDKTNYTSDQLKNPVLSKMHDLGVKMPNYEPTKIQTKEVNGKGTEFLSDYDEKVQKDYVQKHQKYYEEALKQLQNNIKPIYIDKDGSVSLSEGDDKKIIKFDKLSEEQANNIVHGSGGILSQISKKVKKEVLEGKKPIKKD